jgi:hypothetical protein
MIPEEKEEINRIQKAFSKIKKDKKLSKAEADDLMSDVTRLLGIYATDKNKNTAALLEKMISFAENNALAIDGPRIQFEQLKKGKLKIKR